MIAAEQFMNPLIERGCRCVTSVPCSFLTPLINFAINDQRISCISSANEGDAVATACGQVIGGRSALAMMQNSGLGNAVNPITSLAGTFGIPVLLIVTWRGDPELSDEPQHRLMGAITPALLDLMQVGWRFFPTSSDEIDVAIAAAERHMQDTHQPFAFIMRKDSVEPVTLERRAFERAERPPVQAALDGTQKADRVSRREVLQRVIDRTPVRQSVVIATTGHTGRELFAIDDRPNHLYIVGSMGCASSLALGLAMARPDLHVVVIDGDGAAMMRMGNFATIGAYGGDNLTHLLLDNEQHASTGGQATVSDGLQFASVAAACGYATAIASPDLDAVEAILDASTPGPRFLHMKINADHMAGLPRPTLQPHEVCRRLMDHIGSRSSLGEPQTASAAWR